MKNRDVIKLMFLQKGTLRQLKGSGNKNPMILRLPSRFTGHLADLPF